MYETLKSAIPTISARQRQIVQLIAAGYSNEEVSVKLGISPRTAKAHTDILRQKLGVPKRRQVPAAFMAATGEDPLVDGLSLIASGRV